MKDTTNERDASKPVLERVSKPLTIWAGFAVAIAALLALDLGLKAWAASVLPNDPRVLVPGLIGLRYHRNTGAAFGFLAGWSAGRWVLLVVTILMVCGLVLYYAKIPHQRRFWWLRVPLILVIAGGTGNIIDRMWLGYVRDMLEFLFIDFAIFNLADVFIVTGVVSMLIVTIFIVKDAPLLK